jgi:hypothetical protein
MWPAADEDLVYPAVSIVETAGTEQLAHALTPTPLEETIGQFDALVGWRGAPPRTVLWKEGGATAELQADFWTDNEADRQAIEALLPAAFSPGEERSGVLVEGPPLYFSRPVRLTLLSTRSDDSLITVGRGERRLRAVVRGDCDTVSLRQARLTGTPQVVLELADPNDPEES